MNNATKPFLTPSMLALAAALIVGCGGAGASTKASGSKDGTTTVATPGTTTTPTDPSIDTPPTAAPPIAEPPETPEPPIVDPPEPPEPPIEEPPEPPVENPPEPPVENPPVPPAPVETRLGITFAPHQSSYPRGTSITALCRLRSAADSSTLSGRTLSYWLSWDGGRGSTKTFTTADDGSVRVQLTVPKDPNKDNVTVQFVFAGEEGFKGTDDSKRIPIG